MQFDQDILFDFLSEEDKKSFMVWDNVILTQKYNSIPNSVQNIVVRKKLSVDGNVTGAVLIPLDEYQLRVKEKERDNKLNNLGIC
jgi:hypothetical protein